MRTAKTDQIGQMPRLTEFFAGHTLILLVLSCRDSLKNYYLRSSLFSLSSKIQSFSASILNRMDNGTNYMNFCFSMSMN